MGAKESILRKIRILITNQFDTPEEAFSFFDSDKDGRLKVSEIKRLLKDAEVNGFLRGSPPGDGLCFPRAADFDAQSAAEGMPSPDAEVLFINCLVNQN